MTQHLHNIGYQLNEQGDFLINNYNQAKPFASFFPGIAGELGVPMWVFYTNRGQCICSMGTTDKEHPIMEFLSANRAYQLAASQGFRTFLKLNGRYYEPFQDPLKSPGKKLSQQMSISPASLTLLEKNDDDHLECRVEYSNIPGENYAALTRILKLKNTGNKTLTIEGLDGLPLIIPYGVDNYNLKHMRRLVESFVEVVNTDKVPYYRIRVKQEDRPEVIKVEEGNFYLPFIQKGTGNTVMPVCYDPVMVFGRLTDYSLPAAFIEDKNFDPGGNQNNENRLPCALTFFRKELQPGEELTVSSLIGHCRNIKELNAISKKIKYRKYLPSKVKEAANVISELTQNSLVKSSSRAFDLYCRQNFLDNVLRGGFPVSLKSSKGKVSTFHLYSRKHGDMERDYNDYRLEPTPYSQGNGNFRDINQNRRSDLLVNPDLGSTSIEHFYNMVQLDGFNPLIVKTTAFTVSNLRNIRSAVNSLVAADKRNAVINFLKKGPFTPGELVQFLDDSRIKVKGGTAALVSEVLPECDKLQESDYGHCYWSDHWHYNLDLIENFQAVFPERMSDLLFKQDNFTYFNNPYIVRPRSQKYTIWDGLPMQTGAVCRDKEKEKLINSIKGDRYPVRTCFGKGKIYTSTLAVKLLCIIVNKIASLDPTGTGIEMESDKPNWYDALNGLPGQLGSSISETLELRRHIVFLKKQRETCAAGYAWKLPEELYTFFKSVLKLLGNGLKAFEYWDRSYTAKEKYREAVKYGIKGEEKKLKDPEVMKFLDLALAKVDKAVKNAWDSKKGVLNTYFINRVSRHRLLKDRQGRQLRNERGLACYQALAFKQVPLPLFLEGPVHFLRQSEDVKKNHQLYTSIKKSGLFDKKLSMYKVNESLDEQALEIGRCRTFSRGWLENESIWMHMEYKYMLELLRRGLADCFYKDMKTVLVPFMDPQVYGRSILENSSFIASSANPDKTFHGQGFVARLSGSTAEFVHILSIINFGEKPFVLDDKGVLCFRPAPLISAELFNIEKHSVELLTDGRLRKIDLPANSYAAMFLGNTLLVYHNKNLKDTWGKSGVKPGRIDIQWKDGKKEVFENGQVKGPAAERIRRQEADRIDIYLDKSKGR